MWDHLAIFKGLPTFEVNHALEQFRSLEVDIGTELIAEGEDDPTLLIVLTGELEITTGDVVLGRARAGDLVGEIALFAGGLRTASVRTAARSTLLLLDVEGFESLRAERHPVAIALEEHALAQLSDRLRKTRERIASMAKGEASRKPSTGFFRRVGAAFGTGGRITSARVNGGEVLEYSALFAGVPRALLDEVASHMEACTYPVGTTLCTEGEAGTEMFLIASGEVEVICQTQLGNVEKLATLGPGDAFGMCSLLQPEQLRMASAVATTKVVALTLDAIAGAELIHGHGWVGSVLRAAMIRALAESVAYANAQITLLDLQRESERASGLRRAGAGTEAVGRFMGDQRRPAYYDEEP
ncbi:MAG: cyclic nucleotide-binding domain-containing protein [Deltaproteobacteria bacterium]|nr:cyclic nucleotide-binding domain-containing protein [Deltaproteobacteria bacterium]